MKKYKVGDIVTLKKGHPCGENMREIERMGVDMKLRCLGCDKQIRMKRTDFDKKIRRIKTKEGKFVAIVNYNPEEEGC